MDETSLLDPVGQSSSGKQFNFDPSVSMWWFILSTGPFSASGTYTMTLQSGDTTQYTVAPQCSGQCVRQIMCQTIAKPAHPNHAVRLGWDRYPFLPLLLLCTFVVEKPGTALSHSAAKGSFAALRMTPSA